jgi:hypothetical protein
MVFMRIFQQGMYAVRYKNTDKKFCQFEVIYFIFGILTLSLLLPAIFIMEVNTMFTAFCLNSAVRYTISNELHTRSLHHLGKSQCTIRFNHFWLLIKQFFVFGIYMSTLFLGENYKIMCSNFLYPP